MGSKFISTSDGDLRAVSDGTLDIPGASLGSQNLTPGFPVKIDSERKLYSTALAIADVVNLQSELDATIQTPYSGTLEATDFKSDTTSLSSIETKTQQIQFAPTYVQGTAIVGRLGVFAPGQDPENPADSPEGQILCGILRSTTLSALSGPTIAVSSNLDLNGGDILNCSINGLSSIGGKYSQTGSDITVQNTTNPTSILNSGAGSLVFSDFKAGDNYHLRCAGTIETDTKDEEIKLEIMLGSVVIHTTTYISLDEVSTRAWELEMDFSFRSVGLGGELTSNSQFLYTDGDGRNDLRGQTASSETTVNTTIPQTMTATATWRDADPNNRLVVKQFLITKTY